MNEHIELQGLTPEIHSVRNRPVDRLTTPKRLVLIERVMLKLGIPLALPVAPLPAGHQAGDGSNDRLREAEGCHRACLTRSRAASSCCRVSTALRASSRPTR
jgi:hypothetical protein